MSKLVQYTKKSGILYNGGKMVMMKGKKLGENKIWSANRVDFVCKEYKFSKMISVNMKK